MITVLCNIPLILKNVYFHLLEDCVRFVSPHFVTCFPPFISTSSRIIVAGTKQLLVAIWYLFCTMRQLFFETFGRNLICFEEEFWILTSSFLFSFASCLWFFRRNFLNMYFLEVVCL